jgi:hypothetical protein
VRYRLGQSQKSIAKSDSSDDESSCSPGVERFPVITEAISSGCGNDSLNSEEHAVQAADEDRMDTDGPKENESLEDLDRKYDKPGSPDSRGDVVEESLKPKVAGVDLEGDKR